MISSFEVEPDYASNPHERLTYTKETARAVKALVEIQTQMLTAIDPSTRADELVMYKIERQLGKGTGYVVLNPGKVLGARQLEELRTRHVVGMSEKTPCVLRRASSGQRHVRVTIHGPRRHLPRASGRRGVRGRARQDRLALTAGLVAVSARRE